MSTRQFAIDAQLARPATDYLKTRLTVAPLDFSDGLIWIDPAGFTVARSEKPREWPKVPATFDFELDVSEATILGDAYLRHA